MPESDLYNPDVYAWTQQPASLLTKHQWDQIDLSN